MGAAWVGAAGAVVAAVISAVVTLAVSGGGDGESTSSTPTGLSETRSTSATEPADKAPGPSSSASTPGAGEPDLNASPDEGRMGDIVVISGTDFTPGQKIAIRWDIPWGTSLATFRVGDDGEFKKDVKIPDSTFGGPVWIYATDENENKEVITSVTFIFRG
ncbi:hypothetical protein ACWGJ2_19895 [Streptomyces sp. NPDC054796]